MCLRVSRRPCRGGAEIDASSSGAGATAWDNFVDTVITTSLLCGVVFGLHAAVLLSWTPFTVACQAGGV